MRCDEIQEHIIDFLYDEGNARSINADVWKHLRTCPSCRKELEELRETRKYLQLWKDEPPLRSVTISGRREIPRRQFVRRYFRYAAIAAMAAVSFLALANTQITWNKNGFLFSTHLFAWNGGERNYYTKTELRNLMKQALDDSEFRINEANYLMVQKMLDMVEQDRWMDLHLARGRAAQNQSRN
jgi:predicted amidophosphoribosyltransferase